MTPHFYSFHRTINGNLILKGKYLMKYYGTENFDGCVDFKDTEIETAKDNFLVDRKRVVKLGKTWLNSKNFEKILKSKNFVK